MWSYPLENMMTGVFDSLDWLIWSLAQQNIEQYVWINQNLEMHEIVQFFGIKLLDNAYEPIKK